jgi:hypothetical protein
MKIIKLEDDVLWMYTNEYLGNYIKIITKKNEFEIGRFGFSNKKCVINFEKGMRGIYGKHDDKSSKITEIGFFYEKCEKIVSKTNDKKNREFYYYNIPTGRFLKNKKQKYFNIF